MNILFYLVFLYILALILFICKAFYHRIKINKLCRQAEKMISDLDLLNMSEAEEIARKNNVNKEHIEYFKNKYTYNISTDKLDSEFYLWQKKALEYDSYISWRDSIPDRIKAFYSFIKKADSYKYDYNLSYIISHTVNAPSLFFSCMGMSVNRFPKLASYLVGIASALITMYEVYEKFISPILRNKGLL